MLAIVNVTYRFAPEVYEHGVWGCASELRYPIENIRMQTKKQYDEHMKSHPEIEILKY